MVLWPHIYTAVAVAAFRIIIIIIVMLLYIEKPLHRACTYRFLICHRSRTTSILLSLSLLLLPRIAFVFARALVCVCFPVVLSHGEYYVHCRGAVIAKK